MSVFIAEKPVSFITVYTKRKREKEKSNQSIKQKITPKKVNRVFIVHLIQKYTCKTDERNHDLKGNSFSD